jgi:DNA repair protein SbcD/Mre11
MKILHTSDWHLGATLAGRKRYDEGEKFLDWLIQIIIQERIETLIVAGDIFDSGNPSNKALEQYYRFLGRAGKSGCNHIVITAGNHDSPSLLAAPRELLMALDIHVIGSVTDNPADEVIILHDQDNNPGLIICAVPFLRDRDIRLSEAGESFEEKQQAHISGIRAHYQDICNIAEEKRVHYSSALPIIATGHLFAAGGTTLADDGVRDLSIGTLIRIGADAFPDSIDYLALGHLHQSQMVHGNPNRRYSGAPLMMGFGESEREKVVVLVDISPERQVRTQDIPVPPSRSLLQLRGDAEQIRESLGELRFSGKPAWVEIIMTDPHAGPSIRDEFHQMVEGSVIDVLKVRNEGSSSTTIPRVSDENLEDLNPVEVFRRCLDAGDVAQEHREDLMIAYQEILADLMEGDSNAQ